MPYIVPTSLLNFFREQGLEKRLLKLLLVVSGHTVSVQGKSRIVSKLKFCRTPIGLMPLEQLGSSELFFRWELSGC